MSREQAISIVADHGHQRRRTRFGRNALNKITWLIILGVTFHPEIRSKLLYTHCQELITYPKSDKMIPKLGLSRKHSPLGMR